MPAAEQCAGLFVVFLASGGGLTALPRLRARQRSGGWSRYIDRTAGLASRIRRAGWSGSQPAGLQRRQTSLQGRELASPEFGVALQFLVEALDYVAQGLNLAAQLILRVDQRHDIVGANLLFQHTHPGLQFR